MTEGDNNTTPQNPTPQNPNPQNQNPQNASPHDPTPHNPTQQFTGPHGQAGLGGNAYGATPQQHAYPGVYGQPQPGGNFQGGPLPGQLGQPTAGASTPGQTGYGHPVTGQQEPAPGPPKRSGRTALVAGGLALALVSGGIGGAVGAWSVGSNGSTGSVTNSLDAPINSASPAVNAPSGTVQAVAEKVVPSVVQIEIATPRGQGGEGSGVILSSDGLILTNNHVVGAAARGGELKVGFSDGSVVPAKLVGGDPVSDLAVIKAEGKTDLTPIELGTSEEVQVGQQVVAIGSPLGLAGTVTEGIVSALDRPVSTSGESENQNTVINALQTDAAINPGNSGGALVDMNGKLIGINTAIASMGGGISGPSGSIGLGFAIPVDQVRRISEQLIETGEVKHAMIGITVPSQDDANGATVISVMEGGPAAAAGIPEGAVITKVDDRLVNSGDALIAAIRSHAPGDKVAVTFVEPGGNSEKSVDVELAVADRGGR